MSKKILVVDDEETCLFFLSQCLEAENYEVRGATDGSDAMKQYDSFLPDILLTDWMLKDGKDGVDVAEELLKKNANLKVVFITGMASEAIKERLQDIPYVAIIEKPIDLDNILNILSGIS